MDNAPMVYRYDPNTYEYIEPMFCQKDPLESELEDKDVWLMPQYATRIAPPIVPTTEKKKAVWDSLEGKWKLLEDHRGEMYYKKDGDNYYPVEIQKLGAVPEGYLKELPVVEQTVDELRKELLQQLKIHFAYNRNKAVIQSAVGFPIDASDASIEGISAMLSAGLTSVNFCDANNEMQIVTNEQLQTMLKELVACKEWMYAQKWRKREFLNAATTKDELRSIVLDIDVSKYEG